MAGRSKLSVKTVVDLVTDDVVDDFYSSDEDLDELLQLQGEVVYDSDSSSEYGSDDQASEDSTVTASVLSR